MISQQLTDATIRHSVYLERLKTGESNKFLPFLRRISKDITQRLSGDELTSFSRGRLERLLRSTNVDILVILGEYQEQLELSLINLGEYEAAFEAKNLGNLGFDSVVPTPRQVTAAVYSTPLSVEGVNKGKLLEPFIVDWKRSDASFVTNAIRAGVYEGKTNAQIVKDIRGTVSQGFKNGDLATVNNHAKAITRTAVAHVSEVARTATMKANSDIVTGYEWVSTLDSRTTEICRGLDGQEFDIGKGPLPPAHISCRSTTVAVLADDLKKYDTTTTRAARSPDTGKTVTVQNQSYYSWLKKQSAGFQDSVIGPSRGKLLRNGGLTVERFTELQLNRKFQPITLAEMRKLEPLAFQKARIPDRY